MDLLKPIQLLGDMLYPKVCKNCGTWLVTGEHNLCVICMADLPKTGFGLAQHNPVEKIFWGRVPLAYATAYLHFHHAGMVRNLLHSIKYKGGKELAKELGALFAAEIKNLHPDFAPDLILPVPLHASKERQRGFNQSAMIAEGMATVFNCDWRGDLLQRTQKSETQTKKSRFDRWSNVDGIFSMTGNLPDQVKKVMLIDDVITTGATLEACARSIVAHTQVELGLAGLAWANE